VKTPEEIEIYLYHLHLRNEMRHKRNVAKKPIPKILILYWQLLGLIAITTSAFILLIISFSTFFLEPSSINGDMVCVKYRFAVYCCDPHPYAKFWNDTEPNKVYALTDCIKIEVNRPVE
jgi:hypothetical protein